MKNKQVKEFCGLDADGIDILKLAMVKFELSARAYYRILKVARTIADLDPALREVQGGGSISSAHLSEALQYRERVF